MSSCHQLETVRDYAFDELPKSERPALEAHLVACDDCAAELRQLRLTTAALASLPDQEPPRRIAFVSDKVFEPSWINRLWRATGWQGLAATGALAIALFAVMTNRTAQPIAAPASVASIQNTSASAMSEQQIRAAITQAVNDAVANTRIQDSEFLKAALADADKRHEKEHQALMVAMEENLTVMQKRLGTYTTLAAYEGAQ